ncbi:hypothetical protein P692DRAFT_20918614, partial [Suillus brevipes Sb2]
VERTFSNFDTTQSARRCNLSVDKFETLGRIHAYLRHHGAIKKPQSPPAVDMLTAYAHS